MTSDELRQQSAAHLAKSKEARVAYFACSAALACEKDPAQRAALEVVVNVWDCIARRYVTWARALEAAANELED